jgi:hypothetical protein
VRDLSRTNDDWSHPITTITHFNARVYHAALTPDGRTVIVHGTNFSNGQPYIGYDAFDVLSGKRLWGHGSVRESTITLAPGGDVAAFPTGALRLLVTTRTGQVLAMSTNQWSVVGPAGGAWLGSRLGGLTGGAVYRQGDTKPLLELGEELGSGGPFAFSPDGTWIAWGGDNGILHVCQLEEVAQALATMHLQH